MITNMLVCCRTTNVQQGARCHGWRMGSVTPHVTTNRVKMTGMQHVCTHVYAQVYTHVYTHVILTAIHVSIDMPHGSFLR